jgi:transcriptional regulator with XRE-family HTH domain
VFNKNKIIELLTEKGWSQYKLAKTAGIANSSLYDILSGKIKNPTADKIKAIADALGVNVNYLFDADDSVNKELEIKEETKIDEYMDKNKIFFSKFEKLTDKDKDKMIKIIEMFEEETQD